MRSAVTCIRSAWRFQAGANGGGARTLVAFRRGGSAFFVYGYPKNERANISERELDALRLLAKELLGYSAEQLVTAVEVGELFKVADDG